MESNTTYYTDLITKYLSGEISSEEIRVLSSWIKSDPENEKLFFEYRNTWITVETTKLDSKLMVDEEWNNLEARIKESQKPEARSQNYVVKVHRMQIPSWMMTGGGSKLIRTARIAALFLLVAIPAFFIYRHFTVPRQVMLSAAGQMMEINLPDGTTVSLNSGSSIEYPEHFNGKIREINLKGEAFISVKHLEHCRFVINAGNVRVEDIGTTFYLNTMKAGEKMEVILTEGEAAVYFRDDPSGQVRILPGEKADIALAGKRISKSMNSDENFLSWKTKRLVFSNSTMPEVVALLNKVYHSDIKLSGDGIHNCRLTAIFDNQSLESVLNVIKSTLDVSITTNGSIIEISGGKCDL